MIETTLRDLFAVHAPPVPNWFRPTMTKSRPAPLSYTGGARPQEEIDDNMAEISAWDREEARQRLIQWPYYWAAQQMVLRGGE